MGDMSILSTTMENFVSALKGMPAAIKPAAMALLGTLTIIDLLWSAYKELLEIDWIKYLVRKALFIGLIMYKINDYEVIVNAVLKGFQQLGSLAVPSSGVSSYIDNPSMLMSKVTNIGVDLWKASSGLKEGFLAIALLVPLIIVGAVLCFQIIISYIEFYFMTGFAMIFIPLGVIGAGQQYFSNVFKILIGCTVKIATIQIILGLSESALNSATTVKKFDFQASIVLILTYAIIAFIVLKVPAMASSLLSGSPALNGNDVAKLLASATKSTAMVAAAAVSGGIAGAGAAVAGATSPGGKAFKGVLGAATGAITGAGNEMKYNIFGGGRNGSLERGADGGSSIGKSIGKGSKNSGAESQRTFGRMSGNNSHNNSSGSSNSITSDKKGTSTNQNMSGSTGGSKGDVGINGHNGKDGSNGNIGAEGQQGLTGDTGISGTDGDKGQMGDTKNQIHSSQLSDANSRNTQGTSSSDDRKSLLNGRELSDENK